MRASARGPWWQVRFDDGEVVKRVKPAQIKGGVAVGDVVQARCAGWKRYYSGEVLSVHDGGLSYHLKFEDGEENKSVLPAQIAGPEAAKPQ